MSDSNSPAGLTHAPPYDPSQELDPSQVKPVQDQDFDPHKLRYYQEQHARRTMVARAALLSLIFVMLAGNIWLTQQNHQSLVTNLDQARLDQVALNEKMTEELRQMRGLVETYEARLAALEAAEAARSAVAEAP